MAMLVTKKTAERMGSQMLEGRGSSVSAFAQKQMAKMGYVEGKGLGKDLQGNAAHIKLKKREDAAGLGTEAATGLLGPSVSGSAKSSQSGDDWWHAAFAINLKAIKKRKSSSNSINSSSNSSKNKKSGRKGKKSSKHETSNDDDDDDEVKIPTMEEMFLATGGARLGMRARADMPGKFKRAEKAAKAELEVAANEANDVKGKGKANVDVEEEEKKKEKEGKKKDKKEKKKRAVEEEEEKEEDEEEEKEKKREKKKRKKMLKQQQGEEEVEEAAVEEVVEEEEEKEEEEEDESERKRRKKEKKKKRKEEEEQ